MRRGAPAFLLLLAACAGSAPQWARPGASPEQASADIASCRAQARSIVNQSLGADADRLNMMSAPPTLLGQSNNMMLSMQRDQLVAQGHKREEAEMASCLRAKGYVQR